jgi:hypothetical protein
MMKKSVKRARPPQGPDDFYEMMPSAYMGTHELFPVEDQMQIDETEEQLRRRMVRQLLMLVGLLVIQFVLFALLIQSTINLT